MESEAARFRRVAGTFDGVAAQVAGVGWDHPTPCTGWVGRDVVRHLVDWVPGLFAPAGITLDPSTSVDDDPLVAWRRLSGAVQTALDDPDRATADLTVEPLGTMPLSMAIGRFVTPDVLVHTWDLARSIGIEVELDERLSEHVLAGFHAAADMLVASGHFAAAAEVDATASAQDRMLAASGRDPDWSPPTAALPAS